jgi:hypothetical protein
MWHSFRKPKRVNWQQLRVRTTRYKNWRIHYRSPVIQECENSLLRFNTERHTATRHFKEENHEKNAGSTSLIIRSMKGGQSIELSWHCIPLLLGADGCQDRKTGSSASGLNGSGVIPSKTPLALKQVI